MKANLICRSVGTTALVVLLALVAAMMVTGQAYEAPANIQEMIVASATGLVLAIAVSISVLSWTIWFQDYRNKAVLVEVKIHEPCIDDSASFNAVLARRLEESR